MYPAELSNVSGADGDGSAPSDLLDIEGGGTPVEPG